MAYRRSTKTKTRRTSNSRSYGSKRIGRSRSTSRGSSKARPQTLRIVIDNAAPKPTLGSMVPNPKQRTL